MKLSDVVSALHLSIFVEIPLIICFGVFLGVVLHVMREKEQFESLRTLPLRSDERDAKAPHQPGELP